MKTFTVNKETVLKELRRRQALKEDVTPKFDFDSYCFEAQRDFFRGGKARFKVVVASRRSGKCLIEDTLVKTPTGSKKIQNLKPGDEVYGYNNDGSVTICQISEFHDQGIQDVVDLVWNRQVIASCTKNHRWLAHSNYKDRRKVKTVDQFSTRDRIAEEYIKIPGGSKSIPEAYAIGALLGDGCSRDGGICISSQDESVVKKVSESIKAVSYKRTHKNNYTWRLTFDTPGVKTSIPYYDDWCRNKYAHEKTFNLNEVRSWDRESQLQFIAGLIDTNGSTHKTKDGRLHIRLSMQAKTVIDNFQMLILDLFQYKPIISIDDRPKYKNGPIYNLSISNNKFSKRILKELPTVTERKKWKPSYEDLNERNTNPKCTAFKTKNPRKAQCYDITINNNSSLFLLANGLITHNTEGIAADMIDTCLKEPHAVCLYLTLSKRNARSIIWGKIQQIISDNGIECKINQVELSAIFPNGAKIAIEGVKDKNEAEKIRGWKLRKCYIDEAQSFRPYIKELVDDIIAPALRDLRGELYLTGTPGPIPAGYYYECSQSTTWDSSHWTAFDNPYMHDPENGKDLEVTLTEERILKGIQKSDPGYQRETYGLWVKDEDSLVYKYSKSANHYNVLPQGDYTYIMGVDIGYNDADAIAVLAYSKNTNAVYLVDEFLKPKQTISELAEMIIEIDKSYGCVKKVIDAGALGKKITEEINQRYGIHLEAAEKTRKIEYIELMNADLRAGKIKVKDSSIFAEESSLVQWDRDKSRPDKRVISDKYHSDFCDAFLYAYREARHYLYEAPNPVHNINTNEFMKELEDREAEKMEACKNTNNMVELEQEELDEYERLMSDDDYWI